MERKCNRSNGPPGGVLSADSTTGFAMVGFAGAGVGLDSVCAVAVQATSTARSGAEMAANRLRAAIT